MLKSILRAVGSDIAIDLGTSNTIVYVKNVGVVVTEPSVVAVERDTRRPPRVRAVGEQAKDMLGRTPENVTPVRPIRDGVISNFEVAKEMLRHFMNKVRESRMVFRPRVVLTVPAGLNDVERRAVREAAEQVGAGEVFLIEQGVAAALGSGYDDTQPTASMVVDIGGGTTEIAVLSCSGVIYSRSARLGGDKMDEAIIQYVRRNYHLLIGERTAERIKIEIGCAYAEGAMTSMKIKGRDLLYDAPKTMEIKSEEVRQALHEPVSGIVERIRCALEGISPETSADIAENGIILVGGGSQLTNLDALVRESTQLPVRVADEPLTTIAMGAGRVLEDRRLRETLAFRA
jgi:rod shape-determining protein MreB and related proteins